MSLTICQQLFAPLLLFGLHAQGFYSLQLSANVNWCDSVKDRFFHFIIFKVSPKKKKKDPKLYM